MALTWSKDSDNIFERFIAGLDDSINTGEKLESADRDLQYSIHLQNERLKKFGIKAKYDFTPRGNFSDGLNLGNRWRDRHYINTIEVRGVLQKEEYSKDGKKIYGKKERAKITQTATSVTSMQDVAEDEYICPDCGASTKIKNLIEGCPSCGNKYKMSELYPKITGYHLEPDLFYTKKEMFGKTILPAMGITTGVFLILTLLVSGLVGLGAALTGLSAIVSQSKDMTFLLIKALGSFLNILLCGGALSIFGGAFYGFIAGDIIVLVRVGIISSKKIPMVPYLGTQRQFEEFMKKISPEYSYFFFAGKTVSLVKMILLSDNPEELPFYNGGAVNPNFRNIIDVGYRGAVGLSDIKTEGDYVIVTSDVFLENKYYTGGKVNKYDEVVRVVMKRNVTKPIDSTFKITGIHCPNCGGSFDATKNKTCHYCGNAYKMEDTDWSVESISLKG